MLKRVAITGAAGFIGRHCVAEARKQNLQVVALVRRLESARAPWHTDENITLVPLDLATQSDILTAAIAGVDAIIHCAATLSGDQTRDTLQVSQHVLDAVVAAEVPHVVLAGSFDVYDVRKLADHAVLDETCPLGTDGRTDYAQAKQAQEVLFVDGAALYGFALSALRLGAVWGPAHGFNAHIGPAFGRTLVMIDGGGVVPLCRVERAAAMLIRAVQHPNGVGKINVLDDDLPSRRQFVRALQKTGWPKTVLPVPLWVWRLMAAITPEAPTMPGLLRSAILETRHRPLTYDNAAMHKALGATRSLPFETAMAADIERQKKQANRS